MDEDQTNTNPQDMTTMMSMDQMKSDFGGGKKVASMHTGDETMMEMGGNVG